MSFTYDEGIRTEWLLRDANDVDFFLSADDENLFLLQANTNPVDNIPSWESLQPNTHLNYADKQWLVTEQHTMRLDHTSVGSSAGTLNSEPRNYSYLITDNAETLVIVFVGDDIQLRQGFWLDPYELEICV